MSEILARTEGFTRTSGNLSSEWLGHNILSFFGISAKQTDHVDLEEEGDTDLFTRIATKFLEVLGWE